MHSLHGGGMVISINKRRFRGVEQRATISDPNSRTFPIQFVRRTLAFRFCIAVLRQPNHAINLMKSALYFSAAAVAACLRSKCRFQWLRRKEDARYTIYTYSYVYRSSRTNALLCALSMFSFCHFSLSTSLTSFEIMAHNGGWEKMAFQSFSINRYPSTSRSTFHYLLSSSPSLSPSMCIIIFSFFRGRRSSLFDAVSNGMGWVLPAVARYTDAASLTHIRATAAATNEL